MLKKIISLFTPKRDIWSVEVFEDHICSWMAHYANDVDAANLYHEYDHSPNHSYRIRGRRMYKNGLEIREPRYSYNYWKMWRLQPEPAESRTRSIKLSVREFKRIFPNKQYSPNNITIGGN